MKEISIFYGAGAEADAGLPTGLSFLKKSIFTNIDKELKSKLISFYSNNQYNKYTANTMYSSSKDIYKNVAKKTVHSLKKEIDDDSLDELYTNIKSEIKIYLNYKKDNKAEFKDQIEGYEKFLAALLEHKVKNTEDKISEKTMKFYEVYLQEVCHMKHKKIANHKDICISEHKKLFENKIKVHGTLEGYFHTIINPYLYGSNKYNMLINHYWLAYFSIILPTIKTYKKFMKKEQLDKCIKNDKMHYNYFFDNFNEIISILYEGTSINKGFNTSFPYYKFDEIKDIKLNVITTNYTPFIKNIIKNYDKNINHVYLHGELNLFEDPVSMQIKKLDEHNNDEQKTIFPYILTQSAVKPIINKYQIDSFYHMGEMLESSDILIILGYGVNEDDNHINSQLISFINSGKFIIYCDYDTNYKTNVEYDSKNNRIINLLRLNENQSEKIITLKFKDPQDLKERINEKIKEIN